jgi:hypothetical protein
LLRELRNTLYFFVEMLSPLCNRESTVVAYTQGKRLDSWLAVKNTFTNNYMDESK